jgi:hypothetical protein
MTAQSNDRNSYSQSRVDNEVYIFVIMEYKSESISIKSPKKNKEGVRNINSIKTNYVFTTNNERLGVELSKISSTFNNEVTALNTLSKMGWELVDVDNGKYYLKSKRRR